ncbi:MAG: dihydrodipicolinate synthase family protein [Pseudomonadota bacterium]
MSITPFREDGSVDEDALRTHLKRLVAARIGIYLGSPGSGEGSVLTLKELRRVYEIGVAVCKGKVPTYANPREPRSAAELLELANEAISAGVDVVQLYQLVGGHGMIPNQHEQEVYWKTLLDAIDYPICISMNSSSSSGYLESVSLLKKLCSEYGHICEINVLGFPDRFFMQLRDALPDSVKMNGSLLGSNIATLGTAAGAVAPEANIIPNICQIIADGYMRGDLRKVSQGARTLQRFANILSEWAPAKVRPLKMAMKVLGLGNGVLRPPYVLPPEEDQRRMAAALDSLRIRELEGLK